MVSTRRRPCSSWSPQGQQWCLWRWLANLGSWRAWAEAFSVGSGESGQRSPEQSDIYNLQSTLQFAGPESSQLSPALKHSLAPLCLFCCPQWALDKSLNVWVHMSKTGPVLTHPPGHGFSSTWKAVWMALGGESPEPGILVKFQGDPGVGDAL